MTDTTQIPGLVTIRATEMSPPPDWALMQRKLISTMEEAARLAHVKYARPNGLPYYDLDVDDVYESRSMRCLFYAIGADDDILDIALNFCFGFVQAREWDSRSLSWGGVM